MNFTVAIHGSPYGSASQTQALAFCQAVCAQGHVIKRVFFYHEAVYAALRSRVAPQNEQDVTAAWQEFATNHQTELCVCIANALKRGVLDEQEAQRYQRDGATLASNFAVVGLGQLIDAIVESDRYIEFPA